MPRTAIAIFASLLSFGTSKAQEMPRYNVASYYRSLSDAGGGSAIVYNGCIEMEQDAYNKRKADWSALSAKTRRYCDEIARVGGGSYTVLDGCIDMEVGAAGSTPTFKY